MKYWKKGDRVSVKKGSQTYPGEITGIEWDPTNRVIRRVTVCVVYMDLAETLHKTSTTVPPNALRRR